MGLVSLAFLSCTPVRFLRWGGAGLLPLSLCGQLRSECLAQNHSQSIGSGSGKLCTGDGEEAFSAPDFLPRVCSRQESGLLTLEAQVLPRAGVYRAGFVSYHLPTDARQDDDKGDQCSQEDGDYNSQSCVHWEGWLGASIEGQGVSKGSHFVGGVQRW